MPTFPEWLARRPKATETTKWSGLIQFCNSPLQNWILNTHRTLWAGTGAAEAAHQTLVLK